MATRKTPLRRQTDRVLLVLLAVLLLAYPLDWILWRVRVAAGGGMGSATVNSMTAATLKGNHFEVYSQDTAEVPCSLSLLPQTGAGPCWWVRRHNQQITQY